MRVHARLIAAFLLAIQGWVALSGGAGGIGCVRLWACLSEESVQDEECACCREHRSDDAPPPSAPKAPDHDPGCCVNLPDLAASTQRHDATSELFDLLGMAIVVCVVADVSWIPIADPCATPTWSPPPDPGTLRTATGVPTTRLLI